MTVGGGPLLPGKPEPALRDWARTVGDAAINGIPIVGGSASVLINAVLRPNYEKRLDDWLSRLGNVVNDLDRRLGGLDVNNLSENDPFVDAVTRATQIALGTSLEEKLTMLQAALTNVGASEMTHDFLALRFLSFVDELGPEHFALLRYSADPSVALAGSGPARAGSPRALLSSVGLVASQEVLDLLLHDLQVRGLIDTSRLDETVLNDDLTSPFVTELGQEFIDFVSHF